MKRKILSLALALMMIISVAAAMPVSAEVADIVIPGSPYNSMGSAAGDTGGVYGSATEGAAQYWGAGQKVPAYADYTLNVATEGYYNVSVTITNAYGSSIISNQTDGLAAATTITIDGTEYHGRYPAFDATTEITRVYLTAGEHDLRVSEITGAHYDLNNITFSYDDDQAPAETIFIEPYSGSTTLGGIYFWEYHPGAGSCNWATPSQAGFYAGSTTSNADLNMNFVSDESAYYDVYIAHAGTQDADMTFTIGEETLTGVLPGAESDGPAYETNFGRIHIAKGANTINLTGNIGYANQKYIYNVKLVKSADQTESVKVDDIVIAGDSFTSTGTVAGGSGGVSQSETAGAALYWGAGQQKVPVYADYTLNVDTEGYYNVSVTITNAYGSSVYPSVDSGLAAATTITIDGTEYHGRYPAFDATTEITRVYLTAGEHDLRVSEITGASYDLNNITFSYDDVQAPSETIFIEPYSGSTTLGRIYFWEFTPGAGSCSWATPSQAGFYAGSTTSNADLNMNFVSDESAYYDVYIAYAAMQDADMIFKIGEETLTGVLPGADTESPAYETNFGRIHIAKGANTINLTGNIGPAYNEFIYNVKLVKSADQTEPPPQTSFVMDAQYFTTLTSGVVFDATGSTNNTAWAGTSGKRIYENRWGGVSNTIKISVSGYYDVALAYGTKLEGAQFVIYADNQVEVLQTDKLSAVGAGTITESALGRIYLTEGRHTINVYGSSPNDPDVDDSCPTVFYGLKLQYSDDEYQVDPTEYIISAEFPTSYSVGSNSEQKLLGYYITDNKCGWATHGATKIASSADWYEYELTVATAGYYNMAVAAGTTNESCRMTIDVNGVRYADGSYLVKSNEGEDVSVVDDTDFGKVYLKAGKNTIKVQGAENSGAYYFYNIKLTSTSSPAENEIRILDGYNAETATFNAGIDAYAEVHTSSDVKVFIVNYEDLGDGLMKMTGYSEGETVFTGDGFKIVRTTAPLSTSAGIVKAFLWADGTFAPIDLATATVNPAPEAE